MFDIFANNYNGFAKVTRECHSFILVSDPKQGTHEIHATYTTSLHLDAESQKVLPVPQAFVYALGKADEGQGTDGLEFKSIRNYYDFGLIERAKASL